MYMYLPIAEMSVNIWLILGLGVAVGLLSGMFGVGGGFLLTPLLMLFGVPPAVAVSTGTSQIIAASMSGVMAHWRRGNVDVKMALLLLAGGLGGSWFGVWLFSFLRSIGQIDLIIGLTYVIFLGTLGSLMLMESVRTITRESRIKGSSRTRLHQHNWFHGLPFKTRFRRSKLYISALLPISIGMVVGILTAIMGIGGGFIMVPAMIYLLGMPTSLVVGTSLLQIAFVTANVTFLQAYTSQTVDIVLGVILIVGGVVGAQFGSRVGAMLHGAQLRGLLAALVLIVGGKLAFDLVIQPSELFSLVIMGRP